MIEEIRERIDELVNLIFANQVTPNELDHNLKTLCKLHPDNYALVTNIGVGLKSPFHVMLENRKYEYAEIFLKNGYCSDNSFYDILYEVYMPINRSEIEFNIIKNMLKYVITIKKNIQQKHIDEFYTRIWPNLFASTFIFCCKEFSQNIISVDDQILLLINDKFLLPSNYAKFYHRLEQLLINFKNISDITIRKLFIHILQNSTYKNIKKIGLSSLDFLVNNYIIDPYVETDNVTIISLLTDQRLPLSEVEPSKYGFDATTMIEYPFFSGT